MSAKIFGKVWELQIDPIEKLVLLALADHADHEGNNVRPGNKLLCAKTGLSERTIGLKIADFLERGILLPVQTTTGRGNIREFAIDVDAIPRSKYFIDREKLKIEAGSTFRQAQRSKQAQPLDKPERLEKVEADDIKVEVEGSPYKEGTVMNLIGDVDTPHTPSQSFESQSPLSLLGDSQNDFAGIVHAQADGLKLAGTAPHHAASVQVNGVYDAPPPEYAPAPPLAQAVVIAPAQNAQLRALSPSAESATSDQPEEVKTQGSPVSAKKKATSRKAKTAKTDSPEEIQRKADHVAMMDTLRTRTGQPILNGAAQAGAIKRILGAYTVEQAKEVLDYQLAGNWRGPVSWLSVQTQIADYFRRKEQQQIKTNGGYHNGTSRNDNQSALQQLCSRRALGDFG